MVKPTLVVMAAGMGSRYGGSKQIDPIGPNGEIIMDYSIYDALNAGFGRVVFIIKREMEEAVKEAIENRISKFVDIEYAYQDIRNVPFGYEVPDDRIKPWGTGHAVLCSKNIVNTPFAVINADDFYGPESFREIGRFLYNAGNVENPYRYAMVGFMLENTLTEYGTVARGVCTVNRDKYLIDINERTKIKKFGDAVRYTEDNDTWIDIPKDSIVSMNMWGFTPNIFDELETGFEKFLKDNKDNILKAEYFIPSLVNELVTEGKAVVKVVPSKEQWYGVTYREDKPVVVEAIKRLIDLGVYPEKLWGAR